MSAIRSTGGIWIRRQLCIARCVHVAAWGVGQDDQSGVEGDDAASACSRGAAAVPRARLRRDVARADRRGGEVTKGAIYGHFSSKEDLCSAIEAAPAPACAATLNDQSAAAARAAPAVRPRRGRRTAQGQGAAGGGAGVLRGAAARPGRPAALQRGARRLAELAAADSADSDQLRRGSRPSRPGPSGRRC